MNETCATLRIIVNRGKKLAILAGRCALGTGAELEEIAELLAAPIVKALLGKAAVPDDRPLHDRRPWATRNPCLSGGAGAMRHASASRDFFSFTLNSCQSRGKRKRYRSISTRRRLVYAIR
jgi:hypothetical protein